MSAIRPISVGIVVKDGHLLASKEYDRAKDESFYRLLGGGIEFGETAMQALRREFAEELGIELASAELLEVTENIFEYQGSSGHEVAFVFGVTAPELDALPLDAQLQVLDQGTAVVWAPLLETDRPIYPEGVAALARDWELSRRSRPNPTESQS